MLEQVALAIACHMFPELTTDDVRQKLRDDLYLAEKYKESAAAAISAFCQYTKNSLEPE